MIKRRVLTAEVLEAWDGVLASIFRIIIARSALGANHPATSVASKASTIRMSMLPATCLLSGPSAIRGAVVRCDRSASLHSHLRETRGSSEPGMVLGLAALGATLKLAAMISEPFGHRWNAKARYDPSQARSSSLGDKSRRPSTLILLRSLASTLTGSVS